MGKQVQLVLLLGICLLWLDIIHSRSKFRAPDPETPTVILHWADESKKYITRNSCLKPAIFSIFDKHYFIDHTLPNKDIPFRKNHTQSVNGQILSEQIEQLICELRAGKKEFTYFKLLQDKNYSRRNRCGLIVLKFKQYPFVIKVFIESPQSFMNPWIKGLDPCPIFFFYMGGGINRHLMGLTRIKNREIISKKLACSEEWKYVDMPRKWYWLPKQPRWLCMHGEHIGPDCRSLQIEIPGCYAIIADMIETGSRLSLGKASDRILALSLCNYLDLNIDPHISNFIIEKDTRKLVIVDTEHFPSLVGFEKRMQFCSYYDWITHLMGHATKSIFFMTKRERKLAQRTCFGLFSQCAT